VCGIVEKTNFHGQHKCYLNNECKGGRTCTAFGWCRGKALCTTPDKTNACAVKETGTCTKDEECRGERICDDYEKKCDGTDNLC